LGRVVDMWEDHAKTYWVALDWLYYPEDLPSGRRPNHGPCEVFASNHRDANPLLSVVERVNVMTEEQWK